MNHDKFIETCKELVAEYTNYNLDVADGVKIKIEDVFVVWSVKVLKNSKALLSTTLFDGMYYELTLNGDKEEIYLDAYKKWENKRIPIV